MTDLDEIKALHAKHGSGAELDEPSGRGLPDGWRASVNRWRQRGALLGIEWSFYTATVFPPDGSVGWTTKDFAGSRRKAIKNARREIEKYLARPDRAEGQGRPCHFCACRRC